MNRKSVRFSDEIGGVHKPLPSDVKSEPHDKRMTTWFNYKLIPSKTAKSVLENHKKLATFFEKNYKTPASKSSHYQSLVYWLKKANAPAEVIDKYSDKSTELTQKHSKEKSKNTRSKSKYDLEDLLKISRDLYGEMKKDPSPKNINRFLALALNVLRPPLRTEWSRMAMVDRKPKDNNHNYLVFKDGKAFVVVNDYKNQRSHGQYIEDLPPMLTNMIIETLQMYPRKYVLSDPDNPKKLLGYSSYNKILNQILGKGFGQNQLRSIYASHFLNQTHTLEKKQELAKQMLTSVGELEKSYKNVVTAKPTKRVKELEEELEKVKKERDECEQKLKAKPLPKEREKATPKTQVPSPSTGTLSKSKDPEYQRQKYLERKAQGKTQSQTAYHEDPKAYMKRDALNRIARGENVRETTLKKYGITPQDIAMVKRQ